MLDNIQINPEIFILVLGTFLVLFAIGKLTNSLVRKNISLNSIKLPIFFLVTGITFKVLLILFAVQIYLPYLNTIIYFLIFYSIVKLLDKLINDVYLEKIQIQVPKIMHDIFIGIIYFITFFSVLKVQLGIDLAPLLTTSAVISMVIGLALQETLSNIIAGIVIHIEKPFKMGDWVLVSSIEGKVVEINWRNTKVLTFNNDLLVIPNNNILKDSIINFNYPTTHHILVMNIGTSYDDPPNRVKEILLEVVKSNPYALKNHSHSIRLVRYNDFSIDYEIRIWVNQFAKKKEIEDIMMTDIWYAFKRHNIKIPFPIRDVYNFEGEKTNALTENLLEIINILQNIDIFSQLDKEIIESLAKELSLTYYGKDEIVFEQGASGDSFFIIFDGEVNVLKDQRRIATLGTQDFFGEMSLLTGKERNATIRCKRDSILLRIDKKVFSKILQENPDILTLISQVIAERDKAYQESKPEQADSKVLEEEVVIESSNLSQRIKSFFNL